MKSLTPHFADRHEAGKALAEKLKDLPTQNVLVLALPRGGVVVGFEISQRFKIPLNVILVRKIGAPDNRELAIGALAEDGVIVWNTEVLQQLRIPQKDIELLVAAEQTELLRRLQMYRQGQPLPDLSEKTVVVIDDGLATGMTAEAAIRCVKLHNPKKIIFAVPICEAERAQHIASLVDDCVCVTKTAEFTSIGEFYKNFGQVSDAEVFYLLESSKKLQIENYP